MAYSQDQVNRLRDAIATGALTVRNANGEFVTYRSLAEMRQTLAVMEAEVAGPARRRSRSIYPAYSRFPAVTDDEPPRSSP